MGQKRQPVNSHIPQFGEVTAGPLKGWRYAFVQFTVIKGAICVDCRCTAPNWPFPVDVRFNPNTDRFALRAVPGERAKRQEAEPLIAAALDAAKYQHG